MFYKLNERFKKLLEKNPSSIHLNETLNKLKMYSQKIDFNYFDLKKEDIQTYLKNCELSLKDKNIKRLYNCNIDFTKLKESKF
jgi:predicted solute-binding protein